MKIGTDHRNQIWRSLVEFRNTNMFSSPVQSLQRSQSNASTISMASQNGTAAGQLTNGAAGPGFYEVTRYTFKHTISMKKDHDYC